LTAQTFLYKIAFINTHSATLCALFSASLAAGGVASGQAQPPERPWVDVSGRTDWKELNSMMKASHIISSSIDAPNHLFILVRRSPEEAGNSLSANGHDGSLVVALH